MSLFKLLQENRIPTFGNGAPRQAYVKDIYDQLLSTPGLYNRVEAAVAEEMGSGTGGKATSWAVAMNPTIVGMDKESVKSNPIKATALGAIYKMAEIGADAYASYSNRGANDAQAKAIADMALFNYPAPNTGKSIFQGLSTPGSVGATLNSINRLNSEGELYTSYVLPGASSGESIQKAFIGMLDYDKDGNRLDVGSSAGAFLQLAADKTLIGNSLIKMYDYFTGNSPSFFTDYRSAAMYENIYMGGEDAMLSKGAAKLAGGIGFIGAIGENIAATMAGGMGAMAAANIIKGRLTDYEHSTGLDERFDTGKFFRSMAFDAATIGVSFAISQPLAKGIISSLGPGPDGINIMAKMLATRDPIMAGKLAASAASALTLDTGIDMAIDYTFHDLGTKLLGDDAFTPMQMSRFSLDGINAKEAAGKLVNEFLFRSSMRVGSAIAKGIVTRRTSGPETIMSEAWLRDNLDMKNGNTLKNNFAVKAAAFMWKVYPSNLEAVDQIMKSGFSVGLTQRLKEEGRTGKPNGFNQIYNYFWHQAEKQQNMFYRAFSTITNDGFGKFSADGFFRTITAPDPIASIVSSKFFQEGAVGAIETVDQANVIADYITRYFNEMISPADRVRIAKKANDDPDNFKNSEEWNLVAPVIAEIQHVIGRFDIAPNDDNTRADIVKVIRHSLKSSVSEILAKEPLEKDASGKVLRNIANPNNRLDNIAKVSQELIDLTTIREADEGEDADHGGAVRFKTQAEPIRKNSDRRFSIKAEEIFSDMVHDTRLRNVWKLSAKDINDMSIQFSEYMKYVEDSQKFLVSIGDAELVGADEDGNGGYYQPKKYTDVTDPNGGEFSKTPLLPGWKAMLNYRGEDDLDTQIPVITRLTQRAGEILSQIKKVEEAQPPVNKQETEEQRIAREDSLLADKQVVAFKAFGEYLDLMGKASGDIALADLEAAIRVLDDKSTSNEEKALAVLKAKQSSYVLGSSFLRYATSKQKQRISEARSTLNHKSAAIDLKKTTFNGKSIEDFRIGMTENEYISSIKEVINPLLAMDGAVEQALGLDKIWEMHKGRLDSNEDINKLFDDYYTVMNGTRAEFLYSDALQDSIKIYDESGNVYDMPRSIVEGFDIKLSAFESDPTNKVEIDKLLATYVLKKFQSMVISRKAEAMREGKSPEEISSITMETLYNEKGIENTETNEVIKYLKDSGMDVDIIKRSDNDSTKGISGYMVVVKATGNHGFGIGTKDTGIDVESKLNLYNYLIGSVVPMETFLQSGATISKLNRYGNTKFDATIQITTIENGKESTKSVEQMISFLKSNTSGLAEAIQSMFFARNAGTHASEYDLDDSDISAIYRMISDTVPGFALLIKNADGSYNHEMTIDATRTIIGRFMQESNAGLDLSVSTMRGKIKGKLDINTGISRITHYGELGTTEAYSVTLPPDMADRYNEVRDYLKETYGLIEMGNNDSTQGSYYFIKPPKSVEETQATFDKYMKRQAMIMGNSGPTLPTAASTGKIFQKEGLNRAMLLDDAGFSKEVDNMLHALRYNGFSTRSHNNADLEQDINNIKQMLDDARSLYKDISSETSGGSVNDKLSVIAKYLSKINTIETKIVEAMIKDDSGSLDAGKEPRKQQILDEIESFRAVISDNPLRNDLVNGTLGELSELSKPGNHGMATPKIDELISIIKNRSLSSTQEKIMVKKLTKILSKAKTITDDNARKAFIEESDFVVRSTTLPLLLALESKINDIIDPVLNAAKSINSAQGEANEMHMKIMDERIAELDKLGLLDINIFGKKIIDDLKARAVELRSIVAKTNSDLTERFGDVYAGYNKSWKYNKNDSNEVFRYVMTAIATDGMSTRFSMEEAAKRFSPATSSRGISVAEYNARFAKMINTDGIIKIIREAAPGSSTMRYDGEMHVSNRLMKAIEEYLNASGISIKLLGSLMKVQTVEDGSLGDGVGVVIYTGDLKSQSAAFIALIKKMEAIGRLVPGTGLPRPGYDGKEIVIGRGIPYKDKNEIFKEFITGITAQSNPIDGIGKGTPSVQFNNLGIGASLSSNEFSPKMFLDRMAKGGYASALEYRNSLAASLRRGMEGKQWTGQIYNSSTVTQENAIVDSYVLELATKGKEISVDDENVLSRADYQAEFTILSLAKMAQSYLKRKPVGSEVDIANTIRAIIANRNSGGKMSQADVEIAGKKLMDFIASQESKDGGSLIVKQQVTDASGKKHDVYLTSVVRYSKDGPGHTLPFLITGIKGLDYQEKLGINIRGAMAQSGDFDKDTVVMYSFNKAGLHKMISGMMDVDSKDLTDAQALDSLFYLHNMWQSFEKAHPAISFKGNDKRNMTQATSNALFGRLISSFTMNQNALALLRSTKNTIGFNRMSISEYSERTHYGDPMKPSDANYNQPEMRSDEVNYNLKFVDTNLVAYIEGKGDNEYDRFMGGNILGGLRTSKTKYGAFDNGLTWHQISINNQDLILVSSRTSSSLAEVVGIYHNINSQEIKGLLDTAGYKSGDSIESAREALSGEMGLDLPGTMRVAWAADMFRSSSAAFVDYVKSYGGDKGVERFFGTSDNMEITNRFSEMNRKLYAATSLEVIAFEANNIVRLKGIPVEAARTEGKASVLSSAIKSMNRNVNESIAAVKSSMDRKLGNVVEDKKVIVEKPDLSINKVEDMIRDKENILKGGDILLNNTKIENESQTASIKEFISFAKLASNDDLANLPPVYRGLVSIIRDTDRAELAYHFALPKNVISKIGIGALQEALPGLRETILPTSKYEVEVIDKIFKAYAFMEEMRITMPSVMTRSDMLEMANAANKEPIMLRNIDNIDQLVKAIGRAMKSSSTLNAQATSDVTIRRFLEDTGIRVIEGGTFVVDSPIPISRKARSGMFNVFLNNNKVDKRNMVETQEIGRYNYLTDQSGDNPKPLTVAALYNKFVQYASSGSIDANILSRSIYTAIASDAVAGTTSLNMAVIGMAGGLKNLKAIAENLDSDPTKQWFNYKLNVDGLAKTDLTTTNGQEGLRMIDVYQIKKSGMFAESVKPNGGICQ